MENEWMINPAETPPDGHTPDLTITPDASAVAVTHDGLVNTGDCMALLSHTLPL
jgi:hypothetical protein